MMLMKLLDNEEIDAVSVATPDAYHMDPALAAIRHGNLFSRETSGNNIRGCKKDLSGSGKIRRSCGR